MKKKNKKNKSTMIKSELKNLNKMIDSEKFD